MAAPLDDVSVITIESWMAAPSASAILADLGADVIKVEPLTGDPMRGLSRPAKVDGAFKSYDLQFDVDNRGKRSIAVALDTDAGADLVRRLIDGADIFMCNLLTHRQARFGLDPASLLKINPKLVHATLTGYGTTGPEAKRPGYDVTAFFGRSGLYDASREGDDGTVPMARPAQGDHTTGLALVGAILAALRHGGTQRQRSGRRNVAVRNRGVDASDRLRRHRGRSLTGAASRAPSDADADREPLSVRRRQMGRVEHAGRIGVAATVQSDRSRGMARRRTLQGCARPLSEHGGTRRRRRPGAGREESRRMGRDIRRERA